MAAVAEIPADANKMDSKPKAESEFSVQKLVDMFTKLNPLAKEFFPSSYSPNHDNRFQGFNQLSPTHFLVSTKPSADENFPNNRRRRNSFNQGRRKVSGRSLKAQREDSIRRTVYVSEIDQHVTEERLAALFSSCGQLIVHYSTAIVASHGLAVMKRGIAFHFLCSDNSSLNGEQLPSYNPLSHHSVIGVGHSMLQSRIDYVIDCRICGDPHSVLRFAFVEFADEYGARTALNLGGTVLGYYPVRVLPSKTAILPVNPTFLPRSDDEREMCARTVYCTNIDKKVSQAEVKNFFESACGEVMRLRLLGDHVHSTRIAFVEFAMWDALGDPANKGESFKDSSEAKGHSSGVSLTDRLRERFVSGYLLQLSS
ncbi:Polyadenylate-binding protein-interacting protein 9 [Glycine max]|nr:Polyadenylate-binding protein-interacting protein 9 [Glycine max]